MVHAMHRSSHAPAVRLEVKRVQVGGAADAEPISSDPLPAVRQRAHQRLCCFGNALAKLSRLDGCDLFLHVA